MRKLFAESMVTNEKNSSSVSVVETPNGNIIITGMNEDDGGTSSGKLLLSSNAAAGLRIILNNLHKELTSI